MPAMIFPARVPDITLPLDLDNPGTGAGKADVGGDLAVIDMIVSFPASKVMMSVHRRVGVPDPVVV